MPKEARRSVEPQVGLVLLEDVELTRPAPPRRARSLSTYSLSGCASSRASTHAPGAHPDAPARPPSPAPVSSRLLLLLPLLPVPPNLLPLSRAQDPDSSTHRPQLDLTRGRAGEFARRRRSQSEKGEAGRRGGRGKTRVARGGVELGWNEVIRGELELAWSEAGSRRGREDLVESWSRSARTSVERAGTRADRARLFEDPARARLEQGSSSASREGGDLEQGGSSPPRALLEQRPRTNWLDLCISSRPRTKPPRARLEPPSRGCSRTGPRSAWGTVRRSSPRTSVRGLAPLGARAF